MFIFIKFPWEHKEDYKLLHLVCKLFPLTKKYRFAKHPNYIADSTYRITDKHQD